MIKILILLISNLLLLQENEVKVRAWVFDGNTHEPISGAVIRLNVNDKIVLSTDMDGRFKLNLNLDSLNKWHRKGGHIRPEFYSNNKNFLMTNTIFGIYANGYKNRYISLKSIYQDSTRIDMYMNTIILKSIEIGDTLTKVDKSDMIFVERGKLDSAVAPHGGFVYNQSVGDLYIDKNLVTVNDYVQFVEESGYITDNEILMINDPGLEIYTWQQDDEGKKLKQKHYDRPVINLSFDDAMAYARWYGKRLPTYLEWQHVALLAMNGTNLGEVSWNCFSSKGKIKAVGEKPPDSLGLYDLFGNVSEIVFYYDNEKELMSYKNGLYNNYKQRISMGSNYYSCVNGPYVMMLSQAFRFSSKTGFRCVY
jgi:hypothetical protein